MIGAIYGDIVGSRHEFNNTSDPNFEFEHPDNTFTDDTVLTIATAEGLLQGNLWEKNYLELYQRYFNAYPNRGWGGMFYQLASKGELKPYGSFGNGSAMRVSPVGWAFDEITHESCYGYCMEKYYDFVASVRKTTEEAKATASVTHNSEEGEDGAAAVALAVFLARKGTSKNLIKSTIERTYKRIRYDFKYDNFFDETCYKTVSKALAIFHNSTSFDDAIRTSILSGGDVDTIACIVGGIAEAFYGVPEHAKKYVYKIIPEEMQAIVTRFYIKFIDPKFEAPKSEQKDSIEIVNKEHLKVDSVGLVRTNICLYLRENIRLKKIIDENEVKILKWMKELEALEKQDAD